MHQNTAPTCPAPSTSPTASTNDPAAVLAQLGEGAPLDLAAPARELRKVPVSCRCLNHLEHNEPAPRTPLAVARRQANKTEADALDHIGQAACWHYHLESIRDDEGPSMTDAAGARLETQIGAAWRRLRALQQAAAQRWGISVAITHDY